VPATFSMPECRNTDRGSCSAAGNPAAESSAVLLACVCISLGFLYLISRLRVRRPDAVLVPSARRNLIPPSEPGDMSRTRRLVIIGVLVSLPQLLGGKPSRDEFAFTDGAFDICATQSLDDRVVYRAKPEQDL
jgi:hypothetical protein